MNQINRVKKEDVEDLYALTPVQEGLLFHYLKERQQGIYSEQLCLNFFGPMQSDIFEQAWLEVIKVNPVLRTVFRWQEVKNPAQLVLKKPGIAITYHDFSQFPEIQRLQELAALNEPNISLLYNLCFLLLLGEMYADNTYQITLKRLTSRRINKIVEKIK